MSEQPYSYLERVQAIRNALKRLDSDIQANPPEDGPDRIELLKALAPLVYAVRDCQNGATYRQRNTAVTP